MIEWPTSPVNSKPKFLTKFLPWKSESKAATATGISYTAPAEAKPHRVRQFLKQTLSWSRVRLLYARVTLTRFTTAYFFLALFSLCTLAILHALTFQDNVHAIDVLEHTIDGQSVNFIYTGANGDNTTAAQALVVGGTHSRLIIIQNDVLSVCDSLPGQRGTTCAGVLVFSGRKGKKREPGIVKYRRDDDEDDDFEEDDDDDDDEEEEEDDDDDATTFVASSPTATPTSTVASSSSTRSSSPTTTSSVRPSSASVTMPQSFTETEWATTTATVTSVFTPRPPVPTAVRDTVPIVPPPLVLEETCTLSLEWLNETLHDAQREDVVTFLFQVWLFALALVTILTESIPHLLTALLGHALGAGWAAYRLASTKSLERFYKDHIVPEACANQDLMGDWWTIRIHHAIPLVVINGVTLLGVMYLSFMLFKVYARETFSRVGASPGIHSVYKIVLVFSVFLQLSGFFTLASSAMWIDKMCHGTIMLVARHSVLYRALFIVGLLLQFPWLVLGWVCVRKECRIRFGIFCAISIVLWVIPTLMFTRSLYLYIISSWPFFTAVTITAYVVLVVTAILGIFCRLNFGKGLKHYLEVTDALEGVDFTPVVFSKYGDEKDPEKFAFNDAPTKSGLKSLTLQVPELSGTGIKTNGTANKSARRGPSVYSDDTSPIVISASPPLVSDLGPAPDRKSFLAKVRNIRRSIVPAYPQVPTPTVVNVDAVRSSLDTVSTDSSSKRSISSDITRPPTAAVVVGRARQSTLPGKTGSGLPANPRIGLKKI